MTVLSDYVSGNATITNGSKTVTGSGTGWQAAGFREGDLLYKDGYAGIVESVTSETAFELVDAWPGPTSTAGAYRLRFMGDGERVTAQARALIEMLGNGNLQAFAALVGANDTVPVFTGPGSMILKPFVEFLTGLIPKGAWSNATTYAKGDYVGYNGRTFISKTAGNVNHTPPSSSTDDANWMYAPTVAGVDGTDGTDGTNGTDGADGHSLVPRGPWDIGTTYAIADYVGYNGRTFISKTAGNVGHQPPNSDTSDTYWMNVPFVTPGLVPRGVWSNATTYAALDFVSYLGRNFVAKSNGNVNQTPPSSSTDDANWAWLPSGPAGPGLTPRGDWAIGTTYAKGDVVIFNDNAFTSFLDGNVGHEPPSTAINDTYWMYLPSGGGAGVIASIVPGFGILIDNTDPSNPVVSAIIREQLLSDRTYYVRADGNDANNGLANTAGGAFLTIQKAIDTAATLDTSIYNITIQVGAGTYSEALVFKQLVGSGTITVVGDNSTPANCVISAGAGTCAKLGYDISATIEGFRLTGTGIGLLGTAGKLSFRNLEFNTTGYAHIYANQFGLIQAIGNYSIIAGAARHVASEVHGKVYVQNRTVTITGTPAFSVAFVNAKSLSSVVINGNTFTGSATGVRFVISGSAVVTTNNAGATYLPGSLSGTLSSSGAYDDLVGGVRELLTANRTYYVRTDGNDANNGLANTAGGAFLTIQKAFDVACTIDFNGFDVTIAVANGTYTAGLVVNKAWAGGNLTFSATASAIINTTGICVSTTAPFSNKLTLTGFTYQSTNSAAIDHRAAGYIVMNGSPVFGACPNGGHIVTAVPAAFVLIDSAYTISGGATSHYHSTFASEIRTGAYAVTLTGTPAFSGPFSVCELGAIQYHSVTYSGAATGAQYLTARNGVIITTNPFPGNAAGSRATGGLYNELLGGVREVLTANRTYYVRTDGNDNNDGLTNTAGGAFLTIARALTVAAALDGSTFNVTIVVGPGTWTVPVVLPQFIGSGSWTLQGDLTTWSNVILSTGTTSDCIRANAINSVWRIRGFRVTCGAGRNGIAAMNGASLQYGEIDFAACGIAHLYATNGSTLTAIQNTSISGGALIHWFIATASKLLDAGWTVTLTGTPAFGNAFIQSDSASVSAVNNSTFVGSATGVRYNVSTNAVVGVNGGGANYLPGSVAGSVSTGGQYG